MKNFPKLFTYLALVCSLGGIQSSQAQTTIPTWEFTPPKVVTSVPVNTNNSSTSNVAFASTESYASNYETKHTEENSESQKYYPYSDKHFRFLKVVPEGAESKDYTPNTFYEIGQTLPNIQLPNQNGRNTNLTETRGKYTLVHFWASWCPTSMIKVPHYQTLYDKYSNATFPNAESANGYTNPRSSKAYGN